jgi:hypothetical protein
VLHLEQTKTRDLGQVPQIKKPQCEKYAVSGAKGPPYYNRPNVSQCWIGGSAAITKSRHMILSMFEKRL